MKSNWIATSDHGDMGTPGTQYVKKFAGVKKVNDGYELHVRHVWGSNQGYEEEHGRVERVYRSEWPLELLDLGVSEIRNDSHFEGDDDFVAAIREAMYEAIDAEKSAPKTQRLNDVHRAIVRAAMKAEGFKLAGEFDRVEGEEYGSYVYWNDDSETIMVCSLDEQHGDIEIGRIEEFSDIGRLKEIVAAIDQSS